MEVVDAIKGVSRALARNQTRTGSEVIGHAFQKFSVVLMRGNASILATRLTVASGFFSIIRNLQWRLFGIVNIIFKKRIQIFRWKLTMSSIVTWLMADAVLVFSVRRVDMLSRQREMLTSSLPQLNMMKMKSDDVEYSDIKENWVYV